jgi:hypothetical protein
MNDPWTQDMMRVIDKMTAAGWIRRSASNFQGAAIAWTPLGISRMAFLVDALVQELRIEPGDQTAFCVLVRVFADNPPTGIGGVIPSGRM